MNYLMATKQYYAQWLDTVPETLDQPGIQALYSPKRDERQPGYPRSFDLYAFVTDQTTILSYGQRWQSNIDFIQQCFAQAETLDQLKTTLSTWMGMAPQHACKYYFKALSTDIDTSQARQLTRDDYANYLRFYVALFPDANAETWLPAYFNKLADNGYVFGLFRDQCLVSATDAPTMPYMDSVVVEPGINTLPDYRNQGYAKIVTGALLRYLVKTDKVPLWSCAARNTASHNLAESLGYVKFADVITL